MPVGDIGRDHLTVRCARPVQTTRRGLLKAASGAGLGLGALLVGCTASQSTGEGGRQRLRAAFSSAGLQGTWNKLGYDAAMLWGDLLGVEVVWFDGEFDGQKQREKIELIVDDDWDFCAFQAHQTGILEEPVKRLKARGIPVISMDTLLVERPRLREAGVWIEIAPDHAAMAEASTRYLMEKIGGKGKVIHIGGESGHSGAQDRERGFNNIVGKYPEVKVVGGGVRWCNWKTEIARNTFDTLLQESDEPIAGAFFHNDDMALACTPALAGSRHEKMVVTAVDGQKAGLTGVRDGLLAATSVNPTCMIHGYSLIVGQFIVRNKEKIDEVPKQIILPSPLVSKESGNLDAMFFLSDPRHCLV
ncbi:MAG: sugar ABC transporter substrate-binding protein [Pirellulales bacterium]|nr:sugar ABC transporter substrate-binding protein [Pirellulales bacterium]